MSTQPAGDPAPQPAGAPPAEVDIDEALVLALLTAQHPDLAGRPLWMVAEGWDNVTFRLGADLAVRVPRRAVAAALLAHEQRWLPVLAGRLPLPVPVAVRVGRPGCGYPWSWSVVPWFPGRSAEHEPPAPAQADVFGRFLAALHQPAPPGAPRNDLRGVPLRARDGMFRERFGRLVAAGADLGAAPETLLGRWERACAVPSDVPDTWLHGDLHPKNIVVDGGRVVAVLDWGDMTAGDRATDLGAAWMLFPPEALPRLWRGYAAGAGPVSAPTLARARGWALLFGVMLLDIGLAGDAAFARIGRRTLVRLSHTDEGVP